MTVFDRLEQVGIRPRRARDGENRCACPKCARGPRDDALAVRIEGCRATWICFRCQWTGAASASMSLEARASRQPITPAADRRECISLARTIWCESFSLSGTPGEAYLKRRDCIVPRADGDLRYHSRLFCAKVGRTLPAIVARVSTVAGNRGVGIQRIFLDPLGSDHAIAKMRLGGSDEPVCIRLCPDDAVTSSLAIAEGVETALAAAHLHSPIWSTIDAGGMARFPVLAGIESLTVFGDHDDAGIQAAGACMDRWLAAGRRVTGIAPRRPGADINDLVREALHV